MSRKVISPHHQIPSPQISDMSDSKADPLFRRAIEDDIPRLNELANHPEYPAILSQFPRFCQKRHGPFSRTPRTVSSLSGQSCMAEWSLGVGGCHLGPGTRLDHSVLFFLFLDPDFQGTRIGRKTLKFLEDQARGEGFRRMECMVSATNLRAIRLYETAGFLHEGIKRSHADRWNVR